MLIENNKVLLALKKVQNLNQGKNNFKLAYTNESLKIRDSYEL